MYTHKCLVLFLVAGLFLSAGQAWAEGDEEVKLPINESKDRSETTSSAKTIPGVSLEKYPTLDLLNSFTGVVPGLFQTENTGATGIRFNKAACSLNARGFSSIKFIVDDVLVPEITELSLSPEDIESVTLVSDILDKARFGPEVARGAVYIKTLRGQEKGHSIHVGMERGLDVVDRLPEWTGGEDYVNINNFARFTSGYPVRFSAEDIRAYAVGNPSDLVHPNVNYREQMLKNTRNMTRAWFVARGGLDNLRYSTNLGYANLGDIYSIGSKSSYDRINANMNLSVKINPRLFFDFSFIGSFSFRRSPMSGYQVTNRVYEFPYVLSMINDTPPVEMPLILGVNEETGMTEYALTAQYTNPYASLKESGSYTESARTGMASAALRYDMGAFLKGLESETRMSGNLFYLTRLGQSSDYLGWYWDPVTQTKTITAHAGQAESEKSVFGTEFLQGLSFQEKLSWKWLSGSGHDIKLQATYYRSHLSLSTSNSYHNQQNYILDASYSFRRKYLLETVLNYAGSSALKRGHRYAAFPSVGLGWIVSNEDFLKGSGIVDFLKLRMQAGILGVERYGDQYDWESYYAKGSNITFGPYTTGQWFGGTTLATPTTTVSRFANDDLDWEKQYEICAGFDLSFPCDVDLGFTWFNNYRKGVVTDVSAVSPLLYGPGSLYDNYNDYKYYGVELSASWHGRVHDFRWTVGGNLLWSDNRILKYSESVRDAYQSHVGQSTGAIFGYEYLGKFQSAEEIAAATPQLFDTKLYPGDLRYADLNKDGVVDSNDQHVIGNSLPKLRYALNLYLSYKHFDLTVVGTGCAFYDLMLRNDWFWNGWGDGNYSTFVRDNLGGAYPRLSYDKSENNFRNSQFWMRDGGFFKIQNVELGFERHPFRVFVRGANLLTLSRIKDVDPENPDAGVTDYPLFKTVSAGLKLSF